MSTICALTRFRCGLFHVKQSLANNLPGKGVPEAATTWFDDSLLPNAKW